MGAFVKGDVVVVRFPNSTGSDFKKRPAVVVALVPYAGGTDYMVCLVTSQNAQDPHAIELAPSDLIGGSLRATRSFLRPTYLYTADEASLEYRIGAPLGKTLTRAVDVLKAVLDE